MFGEENLRCADKPSSALRFCLALSLACDHKPKVNSESFEWRPEAKRTALRGCQSTPWETDSRCLREDGEPG